MMGIEDFYYKIKKVKINIFSPFTLVILLCNESVYSFLLIILSIAIHETGHLLAIFILNVKIENIKIEPFGCSIAIDRYTKYKNEIIISLSGPILGMLVSILCSFLLNSYSSVYLFYFMILNFSYSIINLIPCKGLDGGMLISSIFSLIFEPNRSYIITELIFRMSSSLMLLLMIYVCFRVGFNLSLTSLCIFILIVFPHNNKKTDI